MSGVPFILTFKEGVMLGRMLQAEGMAYQKVNPKDDVLHGSGKKVNVAAGEGW